MSVRTHGANGRQHVLLLHPHVSLRWPGHAARGSDTRTFYVGVTAFCCRGAQRVQSLAATKACLDDVREMRAGAKSKCAVVLNFDSICFIAGELNSVPGIGCGKCSTVQSSARQRGAVHWSAWLGGLAALEARRAQSSIRRVAAATRRLLSDVTNMTYIAAGPLTTTELGSEHARCVQPTAKSCSDDSRCAHALSGTLWLLWWRGDHL